MIHVAPPTEPSDFDKKVRKLGKEWLATHPSGRPKDLWSPFKADLAEGFGNLCAYSAMYEPVGTVDHYLSCENHRDQSYEWSNYRYASPWINSSKRTVDDAVCDPFRVEDGWFEIILPSLQLVVTDAIPAEERERAEFTLKRLHLCNGEQVIRQRQVWFGLYQEGKITLEVLEKFAPLIARAVRKECGQN